MDGLIIDTARLREIVKNYGLTREYILNISVPQIILNYISLNESTYISKHYVPMFNELLSTYGFTPNELFEASEKPVMEGTMTDEFQRLS
jgi:hypothetical protein